MTLRVPTSMLSMKQAWPGRLRPKPRFAAGASIGEDDLLNNSMDCKDAHLLFLFGTHYWLLPSGLSGAAKTKTSDAKNSDPLSPQLTQT